MSDPFVSEKADIAILGAGIAGSALALILARHGVRTVLIDHGAHPRFALGESTLRPTSLWLKALALRFNVPELDVIANLHKINRVIAPTSGIKRGFGFVYHRDGSREVERAWLGNIPSSFAEEAQEAHLFRQDIDSYLFYAAARAGVRTRSRTAVSRLQFEPDKVVIETDGRERFEVACVVDATGGNSMLVRQLNLREACTPLRTHSRTLFTHMTGVRPLDECNVAPNAAFPWHSCTVHHIFDGGWIWVIPFDNQAQSTNPLCSVGLSLDINKFPKPDNLTPQQEWDAFMERFPAMAKQFEGAVCVQPWIATGRLQHSTRASVGDRFCLTAQASGAVDALFSRGLTNTFQNINLIAATLLDAYRTDDYSARRFAPIELQQKSMLALHDALVAGAYSGFHHPDLLHVWLTIWSFSEQLSISHITAPLGHCLETGDPAVLAFADGNPESCIDHQPAFMSFLSRCHAHMEAQREGRATVEVTKGVIEEELRGMRSIGLNYDLVSQILTKANFSTLARRYFDCEAILFRIAERIDQCLRLDRPLRTFSAAPGIIRKLAQTIARAHGQYAKPEGEPRRLNSWGAFFPDDPAPSAAVDLPVRELAAGAPDPSLAMVAEKIEELNFRNYASGGDGLPGWTADMETRLLRAGWRTLLKIGSGAASITILLLEEQGVARGLYICDVCGGETSLLRILGQIPLSPFQTG